MKVINYVEMFNDLKPNGAISSDANRIANLLICDLHIQPGVGLARFLGLDTCYDNYRALRIWVQNYLDAHDEYALDDVYQQLQSKLYNLLP